MVTRILLVFIIVASLTACQEKKEQPTLSEDKMIQIMGDLNVAEAATMNLNGFERDSLMLAYFKQVFELHGITQEQYQHNLSLYSRDIETLERLTSAVEKRFDTTKPNLGGEKK